MMIINSICPYCNKKHEIKVDIKDAAPWLLQANYEALEFTLCSDSCSEEYHREHGYQKSSKSKKHKKRTWLDRLLCLPPREIIEE